MPGKRYFGILGTFDFKTFTWKPWLGDRVGLVGTFTWQPLLGKLYFGTAWEPLLGKLGNLYFGHVGPL